MCAALPIDITKPQATTQTTATAAVIVTLIAASLSLVMKPASVWSWPWRSLKSVITNVKQLAACPRTIPAETDLAPRRIYSFKAE